MTRSLNHSRLTQILPTLIPFPLIPEFGPLPLPLQLPLYLPNNTNMMTLLIQMMLIRMNNLVYQTQMELSMITWLPGDSMHSRIHQHPILLQPLLQLQTLHDPI
jgi:hypothetical protein